MAKQRKPKSKIYFGTPAQDAIEEYNKSKEIYDKKTKDEMIIFEKNYQI